MRPGGWNSREGLFQIVMAGFTSEYRMVTVVIGQEDALAVLGALTATFNGEFSSKQNAGGSFEIYCSGPGYIADATAIFAEGFVQGMLYRRAK